MNFKPIEVFATFLVTVCLQSCAQASSNSKVQASAEILGTSYEIIDSCDRKITSEGAFMISGFNEQERKLHVRDPNQFCTVKLLAPKGNRIRLQFEPITPEACFGPSSFIAVFNGWHLLNGLKRSVRFVPPTTDARPRLICPFREQNGTNRVRSLFTTERNLGEVAYSLESPQQQMFVRVTFVPAAINCGRSIPFTDEDKPFTLSNDGHPGVCQVVVPGGIQLRLLRTELAPVTTSTDNQCPGSYVAVYNGNNKIKHRVNACTPKKSALRLPCKTTIVEFHSTANIEETVTLSFESLSHLAILRGEIHCN